MTNPKIIIVTFECIVRDGGKLNWVGHVASPLRLAMERCNDGTATEADLRALETVPVFDGDAPDIAAEIEMIER